MKRIPERWELSSHDKQPKITKVEITVQIILVYIVPIVSWYLRPSPYLFCPFFNIWLPMISLTLEIRICWFQHCTRSYTCASNNKSTQFFTFSECPSFHYDSAALQSSSTLKASWRISFVLLGISLKDLEGYPRENYFALPFLFT